MVSVGVVAIGAGAFFASRTSLLDARRIEVSGARHVHRAEILSIARVSRDTNVVWLDEHAAEGRLEDEPWIANANVSISLPLAIRIAVTERTPVAVVAGEGGSLIAGDGTVLPDAPGPDAPGPDASGPDASGRRDRLPTIDLGILTAAEGRPQSPVGAARALGAMPPALRSQVRRVRVALDGTLELRLGGGTTVRFGTPDDAVTKVQTIRRVFAWAEREGRAIRTLSVVTPVAPAATLVS